MKALYAAYSIPQAAALWCGVPEDQVADIVQVATQLSATGSGRSIWTHPLVPCLEHRSRAIAQAIENGELPHGREDARPVPDGEHVGYERRHVLGRDLKEWMKNTFPNEKPVFLFDDIERSAHASISADAYRALKADRDGLTTRLKNAKDEYRKLNQEKKALERRNESLEAAVSKMKAPGARAETTYLNIIGALLDLMLKKSPGGQPHSVFANQAAIIQSLLGHHEGKQGIAARTLEEKFVEAKRSLGASSALFK